MARHPTLDLGLWEEAFTSNDPQTINHVVEVTGGYEGLVNHMVEMLRSGAALAGLRIAQRRQGLPVPDLIAAARMTAASPTARRTCSSGSTERATGFTRRPG